MNSRWMHIRKYAERSKALVALILMMGLIVACSEISEQKRQGEGPSKSTSKVAIHIEGGSYIPNLSENITIDWKSGMTVTDALKQTGIVKISEEDTTILSVGDIALDSKMGWGILVNKKELKLSSAIEKVVGPDDTVVVFVKRLD